MHYPTKVLLTDMSAQLPINMCDNGNFLDMVKLHLTKNETNKPLTLLCRVLHIYKECGLTHFYSLQL